MASNGNLVKQEAEELTAESLSYLESLTKAVTEAASINSQTPANSTSGALGVSPTLNFNQISQQIVDLVKSSFPESQGLENSQINGRQSSLQNDNHMSIHKRMDYEQDKMINGQSRNGSHSEPSKLPIFSDAAASSLLQGCLEFPGDRNSTFLGTTIFVFFRPTRKNRNPLH